MNHCKLAKIPISLGVANFLTVYKNIVEKSTVVWYQSAMRAFMWLAIHFCPDFAYLMEVLSHFCSNPILLHIELVKHILQYVFDILELELMFDREANTLDDMIGYIDSDFTELKTDQKSTRSYIFIFAEAVISHLSKLQLIVALSTCEAKYVTIYEAGKEAIWLRYLLAKLRFQKKSTPVIVYADN